MKNLVSWFEIPMSDFGRAVSFYKSVLDLDIRQTEMFGTKMGLFPSDGSNVSGALVQGEGYEPSKEGVSIYLNGGKDLTVPLNKVEKAGGTIVVPKTEISKEMGFFAIFLDTEGNKIALHSMK